MRELGAKLREMIKLGLNADYSHLCVASTPVTSWLFGDDLPQQVKDISKLNKVSQQLQIQK